MGRVTMKDNEAVRMGAKKRILLVDDEQINLEFFEVMLSKLNFVVEKAENGEDALEQVKRFKPDLIILDNLMPRLSGWEVTKILKNDKEYEEFSDVPIIMFSAMDDVKDKVAGFELGIDDYITKPYNFSEVLARIRAILKTRELIRQLEQRESRIKLIEVINKDLIDYSMLCTSALHKLLGMAENLRGVEGPMKAFIDTLKAEASKALEQEKRLDSDVKAIREEEAKLRESEIAIKQLRHGFSGQGRN